MLNSTFIFKKTQNGHPISNNSDQVFPKSFYSRLAYLLSPLKYILLEDISPDISDYVYMINMDYSRYNPYKHLTSLIDYFEHCDIIPLEVKELLAQNRCRLLCEFTFEGFVNETQFNHLYEIATYYGISASQIIYSTATKNVKEIHQRYCHLKQISTPISVIDLPVFQFLVSSHAKRWTVSNDGYEIEKKFICLNRTFRKHRFLIAAHFYRNKELVNETYLSMPKIDVYGESYTDSFNKIDPKIISCLSDHDDINGVLAGLERMLPLTLDPNPACTLDTPGSEIDEYYKKSLFNIVTETYFFEGTQFDYPTLFLTEKSFKPFSYLQIPIIVGGPGNVGELRELGYDVFDDIVDHSYDLELDHVKRFVAVTAEISRLNATYSIEDCKQIRKDIAVRTNKNRGILLSFDPRLEWLQKINLGTSASNK